MINIYTSKRFLGNRNLIRNNGSYLNETVLKDEDPKIKEQTKDILGELGVELKEGEIDLASCTDMIKLIICIMYDGTKDKKNIFDIGDMADDEIAVILKYVNKFNGHIFCMKVSRALIYCGYEFIANNEMLFSGGNSLGNYLMLRNLLNGHKEINTEENKEVVIRGDDYLYSFELKDKTQLILFDTDIEKEQFIRSVFYSVKNKGCNCRYVFPITKETLPVYEKFIQKLNDYTELIRIVDIDTVDYKRFLEDDIGGLLLFIGNQTRFKYNITKEKVCSVAEFDSVEDFKGANFEVSNTGKYGELHSKILTAGNMISDGENYYTYKYTSKDNKDFTNAVKFISHVKGDILYLPGFNLRVYNI